MKKILVGIQPTGRLHIGHYIGVIQPALKEKQKGNKITFLITQYHAMTTQTADYKEVERMSMQIMDLGFGEVGDVINQPESTLLLFWKLIAQEPMGNLKHLPQFKSKEQTLGMLTYPVLMAADIITSECTHVLVGEDQEPHMEYYRYIARKNGYNRIAESIILKDSKIMSIKDPTKKMSKSLGENHCIYLDDTLDVIKEKLKKAPTTPEGVKNLKRIAKALNKKYDESNNSKSKEKLAEAIHSIFNIIDF